MSASKKRGGLLTSVISLIMAIGCQQAKEGPQAFPAENTEITPPLSEIRIETLSKQVLDAYQNARKEQFKMASAGSHTLPTSLFSGRALEIAQAELESFRNDGILIKGNILTAPKVEWLDPSSKPPSALVRDCIDLTFARAESERHGGTARLPEQAFRYVSTATITQDKQGRWTVTDLQSDRSRLC